MLLAGVSNSEAEGHDLRTGLLDMLSPRLVLAIAIQQICRLVSGHGLVTDRDTVTEARSECFLEICGRRQGMVEVLWADERAQGG